MSESLKNEWILPIWSVELLQLSLSCDADLQVTLTCIFQARFTIYLGGKWKKTLKFWRSRWTLQPLDVSLLSALHLGPISVWKIFRLWKRKRVGGLVSNCSRCHLARPVLTAVHLVFVMLLSPLWFRVRVLSQIVKSLNLQSFNCFCPKIQI